VPRLSKKESIETINRYASGKIPFVFLISFEGKENLIFTLAEAASKGLYIDMPGLTNHSFEIDPGIPLQFNKIPMDKEKYQEAFARVMDHIHYGNSFLLNLTFPTPVECNYTLQEIFVGSRATYKLLLKDELVIFSPERFVRIHGNTITSNPMKGTIDSTIPGAYRLLASDRKEDAEHNTIVDLIRNDLSTIASLVRVKRFKYIETQRTNQGELLQMSSEVTGKLPLDFRTSLGDRLFNLLPAGSVCGAPKKKTVEIIREVEAYDRGFYTGIFGYFNGINLDSAVSIRYIEKQDKQLVFKSGGGITFQSDWNKEFEELQNKVYVPIY